MKERGRNATAIIVLLSVIFLCFPEYSRGQQPITLASSLHNPFALTVDQNNVYWIETFISANGTTFMIRKMPLNGGTSVDIATQSFGFIGIAGVPSITVDNTTVYWSFSPGFGIGFLYKAPITGGTPMFLTGANQPSDIALDSNFIYWAEDNGGPDVTQGIRKVPLSGGDVTTVTTLGIPLALAVVGSEVYFSYFDFFSGGNRIGRVSTEGGAVIDLVSTVSRASDIVADATHLYWTEFDAGTVNKIP